MRWHCLVALLAYMVAGCRGPAPFIERQTLDLIGTGNAAVFRAEVVVSNASQGDGQVEVEATLRERASGVVVARRSADVELGGMETVTVVIEMPRPETRSMLDVKGVSLEVTSRYPID